MKKLAVFLMVLSASMFTLGCGGGDAKKKDDKGKTPTEKPADKPADKPAEK